MKPPSSIVTDILAFDTADLTDAEVDAIARTKEGSMNATVGPMLTQRAKIGFTTGGHTGEDVVLYAYDPTGNRPTGLMDNPLRIRRSKRQQQRKVVRIPKTH